MWTVCQNGDAVSDLASLVWRCPEFFFLTLSHFIHSCFPLCLSPWEIAPLCCRWPFCGSHWHYWAVTSHPLPSAACLPLITLSPSPCLQHSLFHSPCVLSVVFWHRCHYWAARITLPTMSCLSALSVSRSPSLSLSIPLLVSCPLWLCVTFIPKMHCPS